MISPENAFSLSYLFTFKFDKEKFNDAVARSLNYFPLCAGRIKQNPEGKHELLYNNEGIQIKITKNTELTSDYLKDNYNNHGMSFFDQDI